MKLIKSEDIDFWYITTKEDLHQVTDLLKDETELAVDTETYVNLSKANSSALDPHSSLISLIQVNKLGNDKPFVIDVIEIGVEDTMYFVDTIMMDKNITKVFHFASFDIKQFRSTFGVWIVNIKCTRVLMQSLGICTGMKASIFRGHGLKDLTRDYFDVFLDKTEGASQWGARPLSMSQLSYCALDVGAYKNTEHSCYVLEGYHLIKDQLDALDQQIAYEADQQAAYISAKLEFGGMYINQSILQRVYEYAVIEMKKHRKHLVEELGFTVYSDMDIDEETGEWISIEIVPDTIKKLLNNNKALVDYVNTHLKSHQSDSLSSLQADEVKNYLDILEAECDPDNKTQYDEDYLNYKYESVLLIKSLLKYKKYNKLRSECEKYFKVINENTNQVHAGFNAVGTATGRMSSSGRLNLQQVSNTQAVINLKKEEF